MSVLTTRRLRIPPGTAEAMSDEGLRLLFPLAALHAGLWPFLWVIVWSFDLPFTATTPPGQWHAQEMLIGSFGGALLGFMTSALAEWTDTPRLRGRPVVLLAGFWAMARVIGFFGAERAWIIGLLLDQSWLVFLLIYGLRLTLARRSTDLLGFVGFLGVLAAAAAVLRIAMSAEHHVLAETAVRIVGLALLGLLGLALARITVPVTNLMLDPSEETSPYRPHPGRVNLSAGMTMLVILAEGVGASEPVRGYLMIAAGAAFLDRVAEGFVGREGLTFELAGLWLSSAFAGAGLFLCGLSLIGLPIPWLGGLHLALMGGLGLGVLQVLSIAGLLHTGKPLRFSTTTRLAIVTLVIAVLLRCLPEFFSNLSLPFGRHALSATLFALAFLMWASAYLPLLWSPDTLDQERC